VQEDDCSYAAIPHLLESKQRYYSLPVMKLDVEIAVVLTDSYFLQPVSDITPVQEDACSQHL